MTAPSTSSLGLLLGLLALLGGTSSAAAQQPVPERRVGVHFVEGVPRLDFSAVHLADARVRRKLESGLPQTLVMRIYAYQQGRPQPIAVQARSCRVVYDLWEDVYRVQLRSTAGDRTLSLPNVDQVLARCLVARRVAVGEASRWQRQQGRQVYFGVIIELNPLSPNTVQRIRRWLASPGGSGRVETTAFFGSFVSLFVNQSIGSAERTLRFRSQRCRVPAPPSSEERGEPP